jgi:hypothetical protein
MSGLALWLILATAAPVQTVRYTTYSTAEIKDGSNRIAKDLRFVERFYYLGTIGLNTEDCGTHCFAFPAMPLVIPQSCSFKVNSTWERGEYKYVVTRIMDAYTVGDSKSERNARIEIHALRREKLSGVFLYSGSRGIESFVVIKKRKGDSDVFFLTSDKGLFAEQCASPILE